MVRLAVAVLGFVLLAAAAYFAPCAGLAGLLPLASAAPLFSAIALIVSLVAAAAAATGARPGRQAQRRHPASWRGRSTWRSGTCLPAPTRTPPRSATWAAQSAARSKSLSERISTTDDVDAGAQPAHADNVVPHPSARRPRVAAGLPDATTLAPDHSAVEAAYRRAVAAGEFDLSLQPIVSVSRSAATGFEVFANLPVDGGQRVDLRRPGATIAGNRSGGFERILVTTALQAGRRRLGAASTTMPLHVAISEAILGSAAEIAPLLEMLQFYPDLAQAIVLSVPVGLLDARASTLRRWDCCREGRPLRRGRLGRDGRHRRLECGRGPLPF